MSLDRDDHAAPGGCEAYDAVTSLLFGAHVSQLRADRRISPEGLCAGSRRTEEWVLAVERGEIELTRPMVDDISTMFAACSVYLSDDLPADLRDYPLSERAERLRALIGLVGWSPSPDEPVLSGSGLDGNDVISAIDRLLVLGPCLVLIACSVLVARMFEWSIPGAGGATNQTVDHTYLGLLQEVLLPAAVVATVAAALFLKVIDRAFCAATNLLRTPVRARCREEIRLNLELVGVVSGDEVWRLSPGSGQLIRAHRGHAVAAGFRVALTERLSIVFGLASLAATGAMIQSAREHGRWVGPMIVLVTIVGLWVANSWESRMSARECYAEVTRGVGIRPRTPQPELEVSAGSSD